MGSECNTSPLISFTGSMAAFIAVMVLALHVQSYNVNHFYNVYDTSNNHHTIRASNELVGAGGSTKIQAKTNGVMCLNCAILAVCLVYLMWLIETVFNLGLR